MASAITKQSGTMVESEIGVLKPTLGHNWGIPRSHGLVEHVCISSKRQQLATVIRPSPRNKHALLCIWALEGPHLHQVLCTPLDARILAISRANTSVHQVVHSKQIMHNDGAEDVYIHSVAYLDYFDGWAVFQVPAVCHLFQGFDLPEADQAFSLVAKFIQENS